MKLKYFYLILIMLTIYSCARRGNPTGGLKDENEPIIINAIPSHKSVNFNTKEIKIYFDEYIKLKDIQKQLIISPPLKYNPIITPLGLPSKKLTIKIVDTLKANTTYVFNFGESIEDNNEGNKLSNFKYVFSTGNYIDSLTIKGVIADAFLKKTDDYVSVLLYKIDATYNDSTIFKEKPMYIANTLDSTSWEITNIKKGNYKLIALKENSSNYIYDPKLDKIAFIDSVITIPTSKKFRLNLFKQESEFKLTKPIEASKGHILFGFEGDGKKLKVRAIDLDHYLKNKKSEDLKATTFFDTKTDTLHYFYKGSDLDSIKIKITNKNFEVEKVIKLRLKKRDSLLLISTIKTILHLRDTVQFLSNIPLEKIDDSKISLTDKDTIPVPFTTKLVALKKLKIIFSKKPKERYKLKILPNAIIDFFEQTNDTLNYNFTTKKETYYGSLGLKVIADNYPIIIQLLSEKGVLVQEVYALKNQDFKFESLIPSKYIIRVIIDSNQNKKWDTGNFIENKQPEKVYYFNKTIEIKENWFLNETFILE
ncbi:MAG: Ig-like domain-containing protein [Flavobacteriaceae bacterium]|nr:Ig-like domain-containing protein [Flavobacteriaceae bacterium]